MILGPIRVPVKESVRTPTSGRKKSLMDPAPSFVRICEAPKDSARSALISSKVIHRDPETLATGIALGAVLTTGGCVGHREGGVSRVYRVLECEMPPRCDGVRPGHLRGRLEGLVELDLLEFEGLGRLVSLGLRLGESALSLVELSLALGQVFVGE